MGLSDSIARAAAAGAHALVVEVPGAWRTRAAVERAVLDRGWRLAVSPADADVLVVCGSPGPQLAEAIDLVWHQLPGPRVRIEVGEYDDVAGRLGEARGALLDTEHHRHDAGHRPAAADLIEQGQDDDEHGAHGGGHEAHGDHGGDHEGHGDHGGGHEEQGDHGGHHEGHGDHGGGHEEHGDHGGHHEGHGDHGGGHEEHGDHGGDHEGHGDHGADHEDPEEHGADHEDPEEHGADHEDPEEHGDHGGGHGGHEGHGDMDMSPSGIPLAEGGEDRDGLEMDVLNVRLGPVLPYWPAGLVLDCTLQGDVITEAKSEVLDDTSTNRTPEPGPNTRTLDNVVSLLALAGWDDAAAAARRIRDQLLAGSEDQQTMVALQRLHKRVRRSWVLRWSLRGVAPWDAETVRGHGLPDAVAGDTHDRLLRMLDRAAGTGSDQGDPAHEAATTSPAHVAALVTGLDVATARLAVASLDLHAIGSERPAHEAAHG